MLAGLPEWSDRGTRRQRRARTAACQRARSTGCRDLRPDHRREPRESARPPRATAHLEGRSARWRVRLSRQPAGRHQDRSQLFPASQPSPTRDPTVGPRRGRRASGRPDSSSTVRSRRSISNPAAADPAVDAGLLKISGRVEFAPPARSIGGLPIGCRQRPPTCPSGASRRHGRGDGSGPSRVASRPGGDGARRGGCCRARAFGRPGTGSWWRRCGSRVPAARRRAERRTSPARGARAGSGAAEPAGRCVRRRARSARPRRRPDRSTSSSGHRSTWCTPMSSSRPAWVEPLPLLLRAAQQLEPFSLELARETYLIALGGSSLRW